MKQLEAVEAKPSGTAGAWSQSVCIVLGRPREPTLHRIGVHKTGLLELKATASEYGEVWYSPDVVPCSKFRETFRVDLQDDGAAREVSRHLCDMRRRSSAGAAPGCPEINEHRNFAVANNFIEFLGIHCYGLCHCRERCLACAASSRVGEVFRRNSVRLFARWATSDDSQYRFPYRMPCRQYLANEARDGH